jgi:shikimate kinase
VARVLITGLSGTGKSTLLSELAQRGHLTVDTDYDGWTQPLGLWDECRMAALLAHEPDVIVSGTVENQGHFYDRFELVILLTAPVEVLIARVAARTNNPYGHSLQDQAEISRYAVEVEPLLRVRADLELDGRRPTADLADAIESLLSVGRSSSRSSRP